MTTFFHIVRSSPSNPSFCCCCSTVQFKCPMEHSILCFRWKGFKIKGTAFFISPIMFINSSSNVKFEYLTVYCAAPKLAVLSSIILGAQALSVCLNTECTNWNVTTQWLWGSALQCMHDSYFYLSVLGVQDKMCVHSLFCFYEYFINLVCVCVGTT